jgi:hypothetical protein
MAVPLLTGSDAASDIASVRPTKLFIGGISRRTTTKQLRDHFSKFGRVLDCVAMRQPDGRPRGFGYVTLDSPEAAEQFLHAPQMIDDRIVDVKPAVPDTTEKGSASGHGNGCLTPEFAAQAQQLLKPCQLRMMWPDGLDSAEDNSFGTGFAEQFGLPHTLLPGLHMAQHFVDPSSWIHTAVWPWFDAEVPSASVKSTGLALMSTSPVPAPCLDSPPGLAATESGASVTTKQMQPIKIQTTEQPPAPLPAGLVQSNKVLKDVDADAQKHSGKAATALFLSLPTPSRRRSEPPRDVAVGCASGAREKECCEENAACEENVAEAKNDGIGATEPAESSHESSAVAEGVDGAAEKCKTVPVPPGLQLPPPGLWHGFSTDAPPDVGAAAVDASTRGGAGCSMPFQLLSTNPPSASTARSGSTPESIPAQQPAPPLVAREMCTIATQTEDFLPMCPRCGDLERTSRMEEATR